jgi:hypothetical protein
LNIFFVVPWAVGSSTLLSGGELSSSNIQCWGIFEEMLMH